ncbi:hypothetical protein PL662_21040 [Phocaeicola vulgatus]|nr:hypothetical protein [Phocaeicola vulgatus]MDB0966232.1 hypothetical protein [Phocaeicola vulgatus]MDB0987321.1 hypothetical protein [Phocaeicola vulgatus]
MSDLNLENIVGFKAVDKNGNERQVTVDEMTELVSARIVSAASEISTFAAAAAAGTDEFEDQLPQSDTFSWLRTLDGSKNPTLTSSSAAAKVLGELIGIATKENKGLSDSVQALNSTIYNISTGNKETALFKVCDYGSNINHILHIYSSPNGTLDSCNYIRVILSDKYIFVNKLFEKGYNSIRLFKDRKSFYVYVYSSVWTRTKIEVFSENPDLFYFTNVTDEISISDLEEISIS